MNDFILIANKLIPLHIVCKTLNIHRDLAVIRFAKEIADAQRFQKYLRESEKK